MKVEYWYRESKHTHIDAGEALCLIELADGRVFTGKSAVTGEAGEDFYFVRQGAFGQAISAAHGSGAITKDEYHMACQRHLGYPEHTDFTPAR